MHLQDVSLWHGLHQTCHRMLLFGTPACIRDRMVVIHFVRHHRLRFVRWRGVWKIHRATAGFTSPAKSFHQTSQSSYLIDIWLRRLFGLLDESIDKIFNQRATSEETTDFMEIWIWDLRKCFEEWSNLFHL